MSDDQDYETDSDMSIDGDPSSGTTPVLLGSVDEPADGSATALDTRIGGRPIWLHPDSPPSAAFAKCKSCKEVMAMLLQAYAALEGTLYERVIYLFACMNAKCRRKNGSVCAIRGILRDETKMEAVAMKQHLAEEKKRKKAEQTAAAAAKAKAATAPSGFDLGGELFGGGFGDSSAMFGSTATPKPAAELSADEPMSEVASGLEKVSIKTVRAKSSNVPYEPWPLHLAGVAYKSYFLYVENEYLSNTEPEINQRFEILQDTTGASGSNDAGGDDWSALPESTSTIDKAFQRFADVVSQNPDQVVRYDRKGVPLLYSKEDAVGKALLGTAGSGGPTNFPPCPGCGGPRVFEFQLMPLAIEVLESNSGMNMAEGMEWGTILVATCLDDCIPELDKNKVGYLEEWVGVQWE
ncbi:programmed cell death protein 2 [Limtongia smithiae]|uniref:programmed cell death protein 2 n=1 Tax=Limtongia smithiae TaxID=1125753 RepID=UPI0034CE92CD